MNHDSEVIMTLYLIKLNQLIQSAHLSKLAHTEQAARDLAFEGYCRKRCPVCKFDKTYQGVICPSCSQYFEYVDGQVRRRK
jgi:hypothetical protein